MAKQRKMNAKLKRFAHSLADAAGEAIMPFYRTEFTPENKGEVGTFDPVTAADRAAERAMRDLIVAHYPQHGIIGEEFGPENHEAEFVWALDPIDGTKSFMSGVPLWGTLIGLLHEGSAILGVSDHAFLRERFWGDGQESFGSGPLGQRRLVARHSVRLADAVVFAGSTAAMQPALHAQLGRLAASVRMVRYGADCYDTNMLAEGHIDAIVQTGLDIYDIAATIPIVTGAGGIVTGLDGGPALASRTILSSGSPILHGELLELFATL